MFNTKAWGVRPFIVIMVLLGCGSRHVLARPQGPLPEEAPEHKMPTAASGVEKPVLKFSPELLFEHTLESAASPASIYPHFPPSAISKNSPDPASNQGNEAQEQARANGNNNGNSNETPSVNIDKDWPAEEASIIEEGGPGRSFGDRVPDPDNALAPSGERSEPVGVPDLLGETGLQDDIPQIVLQDTDVDADRPAAGYSVSQEPLHGDAQSPEHHQQSEGLQSSDADVAASWIDYIPMTDNVPGLVNEVVYWQDFFEKDVDVDSPISHSKPYPEALLSEEGDDNEEDDDSEEDDDAALDAISREIDLWKEIATADLDMAEEGNPFGDDDEEYMEDVPIELAVQVIKAMQVQPVWRDSDGPDGTGGEVTWSNEDEFGWGEEEARPWEEEDGYDSQWAPSANVNPQSSRLIALIFQTIDVPNSVMNEMEDKDRALLNKEMNIWQILNNFPFQMLFGNTIDDSDDLYDDDEYDYYGDEYDDDDEDEDYEVIDVTNIVIDDAKYLKDETDNDSEEFIDFFYSHGNNVLFDCEGGDCGEDTQEEKNDDFTVISMPPMVTKK